MLNDVLNQWSTLKALFRSLKKKVPKFAYDKGWVAKSQRFKLATSYLNHEKKSSIKTFFVLIEAPEF